MAREKYSMPLKCPVCNLAGTAQMSDAKSHKIETDYDTRVDSVSEGFEITGKKTVVCASHKVAALSGI